MATFYISSPEIPALVFGVPFSLQINAYYSYESGGNIVYEDVTQSSTFSVTAGSLPSGLTLTTTGPSAGLLSGTPTATDQVSSFDITATNILYGSSTQSFTDVENFVLIDPQTINFANLLDQPFSQQLLPNFGDLTYTLTSGALPPGITLTNKGLLSGTPTTEGTYSWVITLTSVQYGLDIDQDYITLISRNVSSQGFDYTNFDILDQIGTDNTPGSFSYDTTVNLQFDPRSLPPAVAETPYSQSVTVSGELSQPPYTYALYSAPTTLPPGMTFTGGNSATISGTTFMAGTFNIELLATDFYGFSEIYDYNWVVEPPNIGVSPPSKDLPVGDTGIAYGPIAFVGTGGIGPYTFTASTANLPAGLNLSISADGKRVDLRGTTGTAGTFKFSITATDSYGFSGTEQYVLSISAPKITISPTSLPSGTVLPGDDYNVVLTASGGTAPYTYSLNFGRLPQGLSISGTDVTGQISGTPTESGNFRFYAQATDVNGFVGVSSEYVLEISVPELSILPAQVPNATTGVFYEQVFTGIGGIAPYTYSLAPGSVLPLGIEFNVDRIIGTARRAGTFAFTITATDANGFQVSQNYDLTVPVPSISFFPGGSGGTYQLPEAAAGTAYSQEFIGNGGTAPYTYTLSNGMTPPPAGLRMVGSFLTGEVSVAGEYNFNITARDVYGFTSAPQNYSILSVEPDIRIQPTNLPPMYVDIQFRQTLTCIGGAAPFLYTLLDGVLPVGLELGTAGVIAGIPIVEGPYEFTILATDKNGFTGSEFYQGVVNPRNVITILPEFLEPGYATGVYTQQLESESEYDYGAFTYAIVGGSLPNGLTLSSTGLISGRPVQVGQRTFVVSSTDSVGYRATKAYTLTVLAPPVIVVLPETLPNGEINVPYSQTFSAQGGFAPYTFTSVGRIPVGTTLVDGVLSGIPTIIATYAFTIVCTDSRGFTATVNYIVKILPTPIPPPPDYVVQVLVGGIPLGRVQGYEVLNTNPFTINLDVPAPDGVEVTMSVRRARVWGLISQGQIFEGVLPD